MHGGWHRDEWRGRRPSWARQSHDGPPLAFEYYADHGFQLGDHWRHEHDADSRGDNGWEGRDHRDNGGDGRGDWRGGDNSGHHDHGDNNGNWQSGDNGGNNGNRDWRAGGNGTPDQGRPSDNNAVTIPATRPIGMPGTITTVRRESRLETPSTPRQRRMARPVTNLRAMSPSSSPIPAIGAQCANTLCSTRR